MADDDGRMKARKAQAANARRAYASRKKRRERASALPDGGTAHGEPVRRGQFYFYCLGDDVVEIYMGRRDDPEREYVGSFAHCYLDDVIAGLTAVKHTRAGR
jgi:hypothetical protein